MRDIGLDVHRDFCEVAIAEAGAVRSTGRIDTTPEAVELFAAAQSSTPTTSARRMEGSSQHGPYVPRTLERRGLRTAVGCSSIPAVN